ncbi:MAG: hypothetical protein VYB44_16535 [Bacteroidota bacterium]|nr:hypothetical protein [uncultured Roseivirga sp.]MEC7755640.1 hypothetical protein [Bacteroidota bacterium]
MLSDYKLLNTRLLDIGFKNLEEYKKSDYWQKLKTNKLSKSTCCEGCDSNSDLDVYHSDFRHLNDYSLEITFTHTLCLGCYNWIQKKHRRNHSKTLKSIFELILNPNPKAPTTNLHSIDVENEKRLSKLSMAQRGKYADKMLRGENSESVRGAYKIGTILKSQGEKKLKGIAENWRIDFLKLPADKQEEVSQHYMNGDFQKLKIRSISTGSSSITRVYKSISDAAERTRLSPFKLFQAIKNNTILHDRMWQFNIQ